jgi:hypothetical protein
VPHPLPKGCTIAAVAIAEEIPRPRVPGERFHHLLCRPLRSGYSVTLKYRTRRRSCARITSTKSTRNVTVGMVKKSSAITSRLWCFRHVFHVGEGGLRGLGRYCSPVDADRRRVDAVRPRFPDVVIPLTTKPRGV